MSERLERMKARLVETTAMPGEPELRRIAGAVLRVVAEELDALDPDVCEECASAGDLDLDG